VLQDVLVKIQENIDFRKFAEIKKVANSVFGVYSHMKGKIGVITELAFEGTASDEAALKQAAKDIAMQAAAFAPVALNDAAVPAETIEKEKEIAKAQIEASGKAPKPEFLQRQIDGRVAKVLKEIVLEDQEFFMSEKNPKKLSVKDYLQEVVAKALGLSSLKVVNFIRFERGN
jgi:elongation factor Ts